MWRSRNKIVSKKRRHVLRFFVKKGEAAKKAGEFADIFATNMGMPVNTEPPKKGVDKVFEVVDKTVCYCESHPQIVDFITGAATFAIGLFAGKKSDQNTEIPPHDKIDFQNID